MKCRLVIIAHSACPTSSTSVIIYTQRRVGILTALAEGTSQKMNFSLNLRIIFYMLSGTKVFHNLGLLMATFNDLKLIQ